MVNMLKNNIYCYYNNIYYLFYKLMEDKGYIIKEKVFSKLKKVLLLFVAKIKIEDRRSLVRFLLKKKEECSYKETG